MPDQLTPNSTSDSLDDRLRRLVAHAGADAPPAPELHELTQTTRQITDLGERRRRRQRWVAGGGAIGLTAAAAVAFLAVRSDAPVSENVPATLPPVPSTTPVVVDDGTQTGEDEETDPTPIDEPDGSEPATTVPVVTAEPVPTAPPVDEPVDADEPVDPDIPGGELPFGFTPLLPFAVENDGYRLDFAVSSDSGFDAPPTGFVEYTNDDPTRPRLEVVLAEVGREAVEAGRSEWTVAGDVGGREVFDTTPGGGCASVVGCTLYVQWDDRTGVSVSFVGGGGAVLADDGGRAELLDVVSALQEFELGAGSKLFRPVVLPFPPTIGQTSVIVADATGVRAFARSSDDAVQLSAEPAARAVGLPDGRVLIQPTGASGRLTGELLIHSPATATTIPFWFEGLPDDGSVRVRLLDAALVDGRQTVLVETLTGSCDFVTEPTTAGCDGTIDTFTIESISGVVGVDRSTVEDLGNLFERTVRLHLVDGGESTPSINGVLTDLTEATPYLRRLDGSIAPIDISTDFEPSYSESDLVIATDDGYLVSHLGGTIRVRDYVGDAEAVFDVGGLLPTNVAGVASGVTDIAPGLVRALPIAGSVWIETSDPALGSTVWIEVGLDGTELDRVVIDGGTSGDSLFGSLTVANR